MIVRNVSVRLSEKNLFLHFLTILFLNFQVFKLNFSLFYLVREDIENISKDNEMVLENVKISRKLIEDYEEGIADRLKPKLNELKREGDSKISLASEKCKNRHYATFTFLYS